MSHELNYVNGIDPDYVLRQIARYNAATNQRDRDDLLYRVGTHVDALLLEDQEFIDRAGVLKPEHRCQVLNWLGYETNADIRDDLPLLVQVFTPEVLSVMRDRAKQVYPDFELVMGLRPSREGLEISMHFQPATTAPMIDLSKDFPWKPFWDGADLFWGNLPGGMTDLFEFTLYVYPDQADVTRPGRIEPWMAQPDEDDDLYPIRELLEFLQEAKAPTLHAPQIQHITAESHPDIWNLLQPPL